MTSKRAATATLFLATALVGCQAVFGLGDYVEGSGGTGAEGAGGATPSGQGGSTSTGSDGGAPPGCEFVGAAWSPVELLTVTDGDAPPLDLCPRAGSEPLNLYEGTPTSVPCSACSCTAAGCALPSFRCFTDDNCQAGEKSFNATNSGCVELGMSAKSCALDTAPTPTCTTVQGDVTTPPSFERAYGFCDDLSCELAGYANAKTQCVAAPSATLPCPESFPERLQLYGGLEASCPACECTGTCNGSPYRGRDGGLGLCGLTSQSFGTNTACTDVSVATFGLGYAGRRSEFGASCSVTPAGVQQGTVEPTAPHVVCCRTPLDGAGGGGGGGGAGGS